jgi:hypothetical protein
MEEIWKDIKGHKDKYQASSLGRIRLKAPNSYGIHFIVAQSHNGRGYLKCHLNRLTFKTHRIIAETFIYNPNNKPQVNHINNDRMDNRVCNLEWVTIMENQCHKSRFLNSSSKYVGVHKKNNKFYSSIGIDNKKIRLGTFNSEEEAYQARVNYEKENGIQNKYL